MRHNIIFIVFPCLFSYEEGIPSWNANVVMELGQCLSHIIVVVAFCEDMEDLVESGLLLPLDVTVTSKQG